MKKFDGKFEWYYFIPFVLSLMLYLFIGIPFLLNPLTARFGVLIAFPVFMLIYAGLAYLGGLTIHRGFSGMILFVTGFIAGDIWVPPILIPISGPTTLTAEQSLASDVFFYKIFTTLGLPHLPAWVLTYAIIPIIAFAIFLYFLSGKKLRTALKGVFG